MKIFLYLALLPMFLCAGRAAAAQDSDALVETLNRLLTLRFAEHQTNEQRSFEVSSAEELKKYIELNGDKMLMGCEETESCLAEIATAMGARFVVFGQVGKVEDELFMTLQLFDDDTGQTVARNLVRQKSATALVDSLQGASAALMKDGGLLRPAKTGKHKVLVMNLSSSFPRDAENAEAMMWTGAGTTAVGVSIMLASGAFYGLALLSEEAAKQENVQTAVVKRLDERDFQAVTSVGLLVVGGTLSVVGGGLALFGLMGVE